MEIDTTKPENYQVNRREEWEDVVCIFDTGLAHPANLRYSVTFKDLKCPNSYGITWCGPDDLRERPAWSPEPGKLYLYGNSAPGSNYGASWGLLRRAAQDVGQPGAWRAEMDDDPICWQYCWPVPNKEELGE